FAQFLVTRTVHVDGVDVVKVFVKDIVATKRELIEVGDAVKFADLLLHVYVAYHPIRDVRIVSTPIIEVFAGGEKIDLRTWVELIDLPDAVVDPAGLSGQLGFIEVVEFGVVRI